MKRFWQLDSLRGIAVIMMITFHILYDLTYLKGIDFAVSSGFWFIFGRITAVIFLFLVGISLSISYNRIKKIMSPDQITIKYIRRGVKIAILGLVITAVTFFAFPQAFIFFGVLHLIGIAIVLTRPLLSRTYINLILGLAIITLGLYLSTIIFPFQELAALGFQYAGLYSFDYFPILPWVGVVFLGLFTGNLTKIYEKKPVETENNIAKSLSFLGRHSLIIYFLHQPILIGLILLI